MAAPQTTASPIGRSERHTAATGAVDDGGGGSDRSLQAEESSRPPPVVVDDGGGKHLLPALERGALLWLLQALPISMLRFWSGSDAGVDAGQALEAMTDPRVAALTAANYFRTNSTMTQAMLAALAAVHIAAGAAFFLPPPGLSLLPRALLYASLHAVAAGAAAAMLRDEVTRWRRWKTSGARYVAGGEGDATTTAATPSPDDRLLKAAGPFIVHGWRSLALACTTITSAAAFCALTVHSCRHPAPGLGWAGSCTGNEDPLAYGALLLVGLTLAGTGVTELTHTTRHAVGVLVAVFGLVMASLWVVWSSPGPRAPRVILLVAVYLLLLAAGIVLVLKAIERNLFMRVAVSRTLRHEEQLTLQTRQQRAEMHELEASMATTAAQTMERRIGEVMAPLRDAAHGIQQLTAFLAERHQALRARARAAGATAVEDAAQQLLDDDDFADVQANAAKLQRILEGWEAAIDDGAARAAMLDALQEAKRLRDATRRVTAAQGAPLQRLGGEQRDAGAAARPQGPSHGNSTAVVGSAPVASAGIAALPADHPYGVNRGRDVHHRGRNQQPLHYSERLTPVGGEALPPIRSAAGGGADGDVDGEYGMLGDAPDGGLASAEGASTARGGGGAAFPRRHPGGWQAAAMATPYEAPPERSTATPVARSASGVAASKIPAWYHQRHPPPTGLRVVTRSHSLPQVPAGDAPSVEQAAQSPVAHPPPPTQQQHEQVQQTIAPGEMTVSLQPYRADHHLGGVPPQRPLDRADAAADAAPEGSTPRPRIVTPAHRTGQGAAAEALQPVRPSLLTPRRHHLHHRQGSLPAGAEHALHPVGLWGEQPQQLPPVLDRLADSASVSTDAGYAASSDVDATAVDHAGVRYVLDARGYRRRVHGGSGTPTSTPSGGTQGPVRVPLAWPTVPLSHLHTQWKGVRRGYLHGHAHRHASGGDVRPSSTLQTHARGRSSSPPHQYPSPTESSDAGSATIPWTSSDMSDAGGSRVETASGRATPLASPWLASEDSGMVVTVAGGESPPAPRRAYLDHGTARSRRRRHRLRGGSPAQGSSSSTTTSSASQPLADSDHGGQGSRARACRETNGGHLMLQWTHDGRLSRLTEAEAERDSPDGDQPAIVAADLHRHGHHAHRRVDSRFDLAQQHAEAAGEVAAADAAAVSASPAGGDVCNVSGIVGDEGAYDAAVTSDLAPARPPPIKPAPPFAKHDATEPDMGTPLPASAGGVDDHASAGDRAQHALRLGGGESHHAAAATSASDEVVLFKPAHTAASVITGMSHHEPNHDALTQGGHASPRKRHHHHHHHQHHVGASTGPPHHHHDAHQRHQHLHAHHQATHMRPLTLGPQASGGPHAPPPSLSAASAAPSLVPSSAGSGYPTGTGTGTDTGTGTLAGSGCLMPPGTADPRLDESFPVDYGHYHEYQRRRDKERLQQQLLASRLQSGAGPGSASTRLPPSSSGGSVAGSGSTLRIRSAAPSSSGGHAAGTMHHVPSSGAASAAGAPPASISETLGIPAATAPTLVRGKMTDASAVMLGVAVPPVNDTPRASPVAAAATSLPQPAAASGSSQSAGRSAEAAGAVHTAMQQPKPTAPASTTAEAAGRAGAASGGAAGGGQTAAQAEPYATGGRQAPASDADVGAEGAGGAAGSSAEPQFHFGLHVLVVDDERINTKIACRYLAQLGCTYEAVSDGDEIVNALVSSAKPFDVILLDIIMKRTNGLEVAKALREQHVEIPLIAATAAYSHKEAPIYRAAGFDRVLQKPFNLRDLAAALAQALGIQIGRGAPLNYSVTL